MKTYISSFFNIARLQTAIEELKTFFGLLCLLCSFQSLFAQEQNDYLKWMQRSLPTVSEFTAWQQKTGELPPDFTKLKKSNLLPDPLCFYDGHLIKNIGYRVAKTAQ